MAEIVEIAKAVSNPAMIKKDTKTNDGPPAEASSLRYKERHRRGDKGHSVESGHPKLSQENRESPHSPGTPRTRATPGRQPLSRSGGWGNGNPTRPPQRNRLSDKEKTELAAAGKCFECREPGHVARNCPLRSRVTSSSGNRPPGVASFSIELGEELRLRDLAASTASLSG